MFHIFINLFIITLIPIHLHARWRSDSDATRGPKDLILNRGFPYENYTVETEDGFLLALHRILHGKRNAKTVGDPKPVVYLQHGLLCTSCDWLINSEDQSLGYILADVGFDVWMGDSRGNMYSMNHTILEISDQRFWDWSWDELASYDLPAFLNFILDKTGAPHLYYVGYSQGTLTAFAGLSLNKKLALRVKAVFALAPILFINHTNHWFKSLSLGGDLIFAFSLLGNGQLLPKGQEYAAQPWLEDIIQKYVFHQMVGPDTGKINGDRFNAIMGHNFAGTSWKNLHHYGQLVKSNRFEMYNYGNISINLIKYKRKTAFRYRMINYNVPTMLFWGLNDSIASPKDTRRLIPRINNLIASHRFNNTNHADFVYGTNAAADYYSKIISTIKLLEGSENEATTSC